MPGLPITRPRRVDQAPEDDLEQLTADVFSDPHAGDEVRVAVLDTWPMRSHHPDLLGNIARYREALEKILNLADVPAADLERVRILQRFDWAEAFIRAEGVNVKDYYAAYATPGEPRGSRVRCDGKWELPEQVADHGLFIADLINQIAPGAPLSVYRVLNDWGIGDLRAVAQALEAAIVAAGDSPLVVNLSLGVCPQLSVLPELIGTREETIGGDPEPMTGAEYALRQSEEWVRREQAITEDHARPVSVEAEWDPKTPGPESVAQSEKTVKTLEAAQLISSAEPGNLTYDGILRAIDILFRGRSLPPKVLLVAAAGNDSCPGWQADPRLPAAAEGVLGVSAAVRADTPGFWRRSSYSNADDVVSPDDGVAAFGGEIDLAIIGEIDPAFITESVGAAVALYLADDRPGVNDQGLVQWSGTSFATPLAAAYAAVIWTKALRDGDDVDAAGVLDAIVRTPAKDARRLVPLAPPAPPPPL